MLFNEESLADKNDLQKALVLFVLCKTKNVDLMVLRTGNKSI